MKDNYDFSQGKRGAVVPIFPDQIRVNLPLDKDILDWFRAKVNEQGGGDDHELINKALQKYIEQEQD
ncbi:hypothetical protein [Gloeothece verrucosa]|uniref:CopG family transcriptional regulator n=1 Tax=Gloeothece verrucosa (strain PCC 7822) TaxID=497965 RepID=E0U6N1_GLOV7|nr:hypothetical protein [Gloeothece verrucosa]ADN14790.1 conserved hypothetical protein [Gloeothece verrucosa PCC 7822]